MRTVADKLIERCGRPGGASRHELIMYVDHSQRPVAREQLEELVAAGTILRFTRPAAGGRGNPAQQFFTKQQDGERWANCFNTLARKPGQPVQPRPAKPKNFATLTDPSNRKAAHWASLPSQSAPQKVVIPAGLKAKVLPSAPVYARHQLPPDAVVPSVVSSEECRPWVRAALEGARS